MDIDFKNMETYQYFVAAGAGLVVIALILYLFKGRKLRVSAFFATTIGSLALGFGVGIITLGALGYNWKDKEKEEKQTAQAGGNPAPKKQGTGNPKKSGNTPKGGNAPSAKLQLAALVVKLNQLTDKSFAINLDDRKAKVGEQLKDLDTMETLSEESADTRLKALLELLKPDEKTLSQAGFDLARSGAVGKGNGPPANPFSNDQNKAALKALQERIGKTP